MAGISYLSVVNLYVFTMGLKMPMSLCEGCEQRASSVHEQNRPERAANLETATVIGTFHKETNNPSYFSAKSYCLKCKKIVNHLHTNIWHKSFFRDVYKILNMWLRDLNCAGSGSA